MGEFSLLPTAKVARACHCGAGGIGRLLVLGPCQALAHSPGVAVAGVPWQPASASPRPHHTGITLRHHATARTSRHSTHTRCRHGTLAPPTRSLLCLQVLERGRGPVGVRHPRRQVNQPLLPSLRQDRSGRHVPSTRQCTPLARTLVCVHVCVRVCTRACVCVCVSVSVSGVW